MKMLLKLAVTIPISFTGLLVNSYVLMKVFNWIVEPVLKAPHTSYIEALVMVVVISFLGSFFKTPKDYDVKKDFENMVVESVSKTISRALVFLLTAGVITLFI